VHNLERSDDAAVCEIQQLISPKERLTEMMPLTTSSQVKNSLKDSGQRGRIAAEENVVTARSYTVDAQCCSALSSTDDRSSIRQHRTKKWQFNYSRN